MALKLRTTLNRIKHLRSWRGQEKLKFKLRSPTIIYKLNMNINGFCMHMKIELFNKFSVYIRDRVSGLLGS